MFDVSHILARIESGDQAAWILGISPKTADRYWVHARAWLRRETEGGDRLRIISENE
ncbi:MAG: hypothetical protein ACK5OB_17530 [Pirellula sp.]